MVQLLRILFIILHIAKTYRYDKQNIKNPDGSRFLPYRVRISPGPAGRTDGLRLSSHSLLHSLDPVAVDRACVDAVKASTDHGKIHLEERMASRNATHVLDYAEDLGMGTQKYVLITIE